jgi:LysM repeat protein
MFSKLGKIWLVVLFVFVLIAGNTPQNASAATTCRTYYVVQEGDTTPKISHTFDLKWREIADANDLPYTWKPVTGTKLCIPGDESSSSSSSSSSTSTSFPEDSKASYTAKVVGKNVYITLSNFSKKQAYYVKVRDGTSWIGGWNKIGTVKVPKKTSVTKRYTLPEDLKGAIYIDVCVKNATTDSLVCRTVMHQY